MTRWIKKRKLIEVALPLDVISRESVREKSIRQGLPSHSHLWWARRPFVAVRAVLWASLVDDPSAHPDRFPTEADQARERNRLFGILEKLVVWKNSNDPEVLAKARAEIKASCDGESISERKPSWIVAKSRVVLPGGRNNPSSHHRARSMLGKVAGESGPGGRLSPVRSRI